MASTGIDILIRAHDQASTTINRVRTAGKSLDTTMGRATTTATRMSTTTSRAWSAMGQRAKIAAASAGVAMVAFGVKSVNAASDLEESLNKVKVVFGDNATAIEAWSKTAADNLGMSQQKALEAAGTFGNLFDAMELTPELTKNMSQGLVNLSADLASFNNMDPTEVLDKLRSGLVGEVEPLRTLGVNLNQATLEAKAMELGLMKTGQELTAGAKAQAAYAIILEQTTNAQGDFARTSDGFANQQRKLGATFEDLAASVGKILLPHLSKLVGWFLKNKDDVVNAIESIVGIIATFVRGIAKAIGWITKFIGWMSKFKEAIVDASVGVVGQAIRDNEFFARSVRASLGLDAKDIPGAASGGIFPSTPGGRIIRISEGGQDEAVVRAGEAFVRGGGGMRSGGGHSAGSTRIVLDAGSIGQLTGYIDERGAMQAEAQSRHDAVAGSRR